MTSANPKYNTWWLFGAFSLSVLASCILFHHLVFLQSMPLGFWEYLVTKLAVALLVGSFVFITPRTWWTLVLSFIISLWVSANWIYFRINGLFLSWSVIRIAGNLQGFSDSVLPFLNYQLWLIWLPTIVYCAAYPFLSGIGRRQRKPFVSMFVLGVLFSMTGNLLIHTLRHERGYDDGPLTMTKTLPLYINEKRIMQDFESEYGLVREHSIVAYLPLSVVYDIKMHHLLAYTDISLTPDEQESLSQILSVTPDALQPVTNLVVIIIESWESWSLEIEQAMPRIREWMKHSPHLYADKVISQNRHGMSGDGQMIINTGLLPIESGVACILYGTNTYPNFAHLFLDGLIVSPSKGTWNQNIVTYSYGYSRLREPSHIQTISWNDAEVFDAAEEEIGALRQPFCLQPITVASHLPFNRVPGCLSDLPASLTDDKQRYLTCLHYTDSCIGAFIDDLRAQARYANTTFMLTGDHTIFHENQPTYVPLLVFSPYIEQSEHIEEVCYQMDIFPTIMHAIHCDAYGWKGFGVNLLDSAARKNRHIFEQEAYELSDKLIRSNYFATIKQ